MTVWTDDQEEEITLATGAVVESWARDLFLALLALNHTFHIDEDRGRVTISDRDRLTTNQKYLLDTCPSYFYELAKEHEWLQRHAH